MSEWLYFVIEMEIYLCNVWNENLLVKSKIFSCKKNEVWGKMKNKKKFWFVWCYEDNEIIIW